MGDRDVPFEIDATCDWCGATGAYDIMGDYYCSPCLERYEDESDSAIAPNQKGRRMDSCTFGDSQGAINLVSILSRPENKQYCRAVSRLIHKCQQQMRDIMSITNPDLRITVLDIWRQRFVALVQSRGFPENVTTHACSTIVTSYRRLLRESNPRVYKPKKDVT